MATGYPVATQIVWSVDTDQDEKYQISSSNTVSSYTEVLIYFFHEGKTCVDKQILENSVEKSHQNPLIPLLLCPFDFASESNDKLVV